MASVESAAARPTESLASAASSDIIIHMNGVNKWFGEFHVLKDINLSVHSQERIVICGPSGSGKSTLIRCINHLEPHQEGTIVVDGDPESYDVVLAISEAFVAQGAHTAYRLGAALLAADCGEHATPVLTAAFDQASALRATPLAAQITTLALHSRIPVPGGIRRPPRPIP